MKNFTVKIPAGIRNYEKIRLIGQGKPGENGGKTETYLLELILKMIKSFL